MGSKITLCAGVAVVAAVLIPTAYASGNGGRDGGGRGEGARVSVTPSRPSPGSEVTLRASGCDGRTATAASAAFVADARLVVADGADGGLVGDTRIRSSLAAGGYDVRITCANVQVKGRIEVRKPAPAALDDPSAPSDDPAASATSGDPSAASGDASAPAPAALTGLVDLTAPTPPAEAAASPVAPTPLAMPAAPTHPAPSGAASPAIPAAPTIPASPVAPVRAGGGGAAPPASADEVRVDARGPGTVQAVVGLVLAGVAAAVVVCRGLRRRRGTD
ncbi:hypothetical protein [Streptomyces hayashii]|uniref:hypothetical protein n=1 Tax=Streptomyces hayashii TaxID=2839966 RepID=UPI00403D0381